MSVSPADEVHDEEKGQDKTDAYYVISGLKGDCECGGKTFSEDCLKKCFETFVISENKANYSTQVLEKSWMIETDLTLYDQAPEMIIVEIFNRNWDVPTERMCYKGCAISIPWHP